MKKPFLALLLGVALTACASQPPAPPPAPLTFGGPDKIYLNTQVVRVVDRTPSVPNRLPSVAHLFKPTLADAVRDWSMNSLQASGVAGQTTVAIKKASVVEEPLLIERGLKYVFDRQQSRRYTATLEVEITSQSADGAIANAHAEVKQMATLPEDPKKEEKDQIYTAMLKGLMRDLDAGLTQSMREYMGSVIVPASQAGGGSGVVFR